MKSEQVDKFKSFLTELKNTEIGLKNSPYIYDVLFGILSNMKYKDKFAFYLYYLFEFKKESRDEMDRILNIELIEVMNKLVNEALEE
jgi:hypothetical protein